MVRFHPDVAWSVDCRGLSLVHLKTGDRVCLVYPEAALWDLLSREVEMTRIIRIMTALTSLEDPAVRLWCRRTVQGWIDAGWMLEDGKAAS